MNNTGHIKPDWRWGTAEGSREFDRLNDRLLSFHEILEWLEEMEDLSERFRQSRERGTATPSETAALNDAPNPGPDV